MTQPSAIAAASDEELTQRPFDELVVELQRVVQALEGGNVGLEASIALYRDALRLHAACEARLAQAELTISELGRRAVEPSAERATDDESPSS
jgi:exodeoxyribonuclease VII small subunit